jgi:hypothetical protein
MEVKGIKSILNKLISRIGTIINEGISEKVFQPEDQLYFRWKVKDFKYGDRGIESSRAEGEFITKKSWFRITQKIADTIKESSEYRLALESLTTFLGQNKKTPHNLESFINQAIYEHLYPEDERIIKKRDLIERFIDDLLEKPIRYGAEVQLQGIVIKSQKIEPAPGIIIRQPVISDLERETPYYGPSLTGPHLANPSAIANIEFLGRQANEIQKRVRKLIVMLRLFKVGSIKYLSYQMYSDSITDIMARGTFIPGGYDIARETSIINSNDEQKLKLFWQTLEECLPQSLYEFGEKEINHISLAYDRYSDALMHNSILERRIANSVMGLEALLLDATQELSYRLGLRTAKIMSLLGIDPQEARQLIKDAYRIRNLFAHGSHLSYKEKRKLELRYKDIKNIFQAITDYLRRLIVIMILNHKTKDEFIDLIDNSLVDRKKEEELNNLLSLAKQILI